MSDGHVALLRASVEANVALVGGNPAAVRALIDIARNVPAQSTGVNQRGRVRGALPQRASGGSLPLLRPADRDDALTSGLDAVVVTAAANVPEPAELTRIGRDLADPFVQATAVHPDKETS